MRWPVSAPPAMAGLPVSAEAQVSVFRLQALNESGVREGTCFVIRQETTADGTFLVLVTSARLFERESGRRARVYLDNQTPVAVGIGIGAETRFTGKINKITLEVSPAK